MIVLRIIGIGLVLLGLVFCITIVGAAIGLPMILVGAVLAFVGKTRAPIVLEVKKDSSLT